MLPEPAALNPFGGSALAKVFFFSPPFLATLLNMEFPGQGSDPSHSCNLQQSFSSTRSLSHCVRLRIEPASQCCRDAPDLVLAWKLQAKVLVLAPPCPPLLLLGSAPLPPTSLIFFFFFLVFLGQHLPYGGSQARGRIRATATSLHHSLGSAESESYL